MIEIFWMIHQKIGKKNIEIREKIESRQGNGYKEKRFIDYPYFKLGEKRLKENKDSLSI